MRTSSGFPTFAEFLRATTGNDPFPWQTRLSEYVERSGRFPDAINIPTGLGKTTSMLVHLHALARDVHFNGVQNRTVPLRCFHIVERREVVDTSFLLARKAADAVNAATDSGSALYPVREALSFLIPSEMREFEPVVSAVSLHGGIYTRGDWVRPVGAQLVTATVTQIVSRALFRGVGVSQNTSPMHAAVTGMDRVILVDEPHLSEAAISALKDSEDVQRSALRGIGVPIGQTVILGATAPAHLLEGALLAVDDSDAQHPVAGMRLRAAKTIRLVIVNGTEKNLVDAMVEAAVDAHERDTQRGAGAQGGEHGVLVFANTVKMAQKIYAALSKNKKISGRLRLVHGRLRRADRPILDLAPGDITVATQTLEVGADIDGFEVITQPSSLSSLIQRAGRDNRYGKMAESQVLVFVTRKVKGTSKSDEDDADVDVESMASDLDAPEEADRAIGELVLDGGTRAVYGDRARALLTALVTLTDGGRVPIPAAPSDIGAFREDAIAAAGAEVLDPPIRTATLRPQVARFAAYTDPGTDFPLEAFLSGPDIRRTVDVAVAWRDSTTLDILGDVGLQDDETVQVPLPALRDLLEIASNHKLNPTAHLDDLDAGSAPTDKDNKYRTDTREVLRRVRVRAGREWATPKSLRDISPGSRVVLDTALGGYIAPTMGGAPGFDAKSRDAVTDVSAAVACGNGRGRFLLTNRELTVELNDDFAADSSGRSAAERVRKFLLESGSIAEKVRVAVVPIDALNLGGGNGDESENNDNGENEDSGSTVDELTFSFVISLSDGRTDLGSNTCRAVLLADHGHQVGQWSEQSAAVLPLPDVEAERIAAAGYRHDHGKSERAFQASMGHSGVPHTPAWAKSLRDRSKAERRRLREQAGLSADWRHEVASAVGIDDPLTRHLVVSHHMWGRPLIVHPDDDGGPDSRITEHVETFDVLTDQYGPWGLALLETVMRWSDHRASAHPKTYDVDPVPVAVDKILVPRCFTTADPEHELRLLGLTASPMAGTLAAVGLLDRIVRDGLDPLAVIRWEPDTGIPVIGTSRDIRREVDEMVHDIEPWNAVAQWIRKIFGDKASFTERYAKVPISDPFVMRGVPDFGDYVELLHQLLPDTQKLVMPNPKKSTGSGPGDSEDTTDETDGDTGADTADPDTEGLSFKLRCLIFHNNGTPFRAALIASPTGHFFDPRAGYVEGAECKSGGVDVHPDFYPERVLRQDTASWALAGTRVLGWGAVNSVDNPRRVVLPTPARWTTLAGYRALASCGGIPGKGPSLAWESVGTRRDARDEQIKVWVPAVEDDREQ